MDKNYEKLMQYGLSILAKKRYTVSEITKKLKSYINKRKLDGDQLLDEVIDRLIELRYLDDEAYVRDYIMQRIKLRPRGERLLMRELKLKGVDGQLLETAFSEIEIDEVEMATKLLEKKMARWLKYSQFEQKGKAYAFLSSKGFDRDAIYKSIGCCYGNDRS